MSWMQKLYDTHPYIEKQYSLFAMWPIAHMKKNAHVEVYIDSNGGFRGSKLLDGESAVTLIPVTEKSSARTSNKAPHPLCEELSYCAFDLPDADKEKQNLYSVQLEQWADDPLYSHHKVKKIANYLKKATLYHDLSGDLKFPLSFKSKSGNVQKIVLDKVFVRWCVEDVGGVAAGTWEDQTLIDSWIAFEAHRSREFIETEVSISDNKGELATTVHRELPKDKGFCFITGEDNVRLAKYHPRYLRNAADGARIISQNDWDGLTFSGRFTDEKPPESKYKKINTRTNSKSKSYQSIFPSQVSEVSFEVSQKAHSALRWLIARQGSRNGDQVTVAWAVSAKPLPQPLDDCFNYFRDDASLELIESAAGTGEELACAKDFSTDLGQNAALKLKLILRGYRQQLSDTDQLSIITLDAATPGRISISYYRECLPDEYFNALNDWYENFSWYMRQSEEVESAGKKRNKREIWPVIAPSPYAIAQAAYGKTLTDSLKKQTYMRILPCVVEGRAFPWDLVKTTIQCACNPHAVDHWEWQRNIGVACALYKGFYSRHPNLNQRRIYTVGLDENIRSRDYLFGRLLAVAERTEEIALSLAAENRATTAERYIQQFANNPYQTWRNIELSLTPYKARLRNNRGAFLAKMEKSFDEIMNIFDPDDFSSNAKLSGEFLLGYHCQKMALKNDHNTKTEVIGGDDELNKKN